MSQMRRQFGRRARGVWREEGQGQRKGRKRAMRREKMGRREGREKEERMKQRRREKGKKGSEKRKKKHPVCPALVREGDRFVVLGGEGRESGAKVRGW